VLECTEYIEQLPIPKECGRIFQTKGEVKMGKKTRILLVLLVLLVVSVFFIVLVGKNIVLQKDLGSFQQMLGLYTDEGLRGPSVGERDAYIHNGNYEEAIIPKVIKTAKELGISYYVTTGYSNNCAEDCKSYSRYKAFHIKISDTVAFWQRFIEDNPELYESGSLQSRVEITQNCGE